MSNPTAGQLIHALAAVDDAIDMKNGELRTLKLERDGIVEQLERLMDEQETTMLAAGGLVCEAKFEDVPQIKDWGAFEKYILRHKRLELLQRRVSPVAWRALLEELGTAVPGVVPFSKRKLSVRSKGK